MRHFWGCVKVGLLVLCASTGMTVVVYAQPQTTPASNEGISLSAATLEAGRTVDLSAVPWRFHEGDDPAWADPTFDDTGWTLMETTGEGPEAWQGLGWFRLHLRVDATLHQAIVGLAMYHVGASEIYLDGRRIAAYGTIGATPAEDVHYTPKGQPVGVLLDDRDAHVLAVRFTNRAIAARDREKYQSLARYPLGFALELGPNQPMVDSYIRGTGFQWFTAMVFGLTLLLTIIHFVLMLLERRNRANLYFGLAMLAISIAFPAGATFGDSELIYSGYLDRSWFLLLAAFGWNSYFLFLLATIYATFAPHWIRYIWIFVVTALASVVLMYKVPLVVLFVGSLGIMILEALRVTIYGVYKRKEDAWILLVGYIVTFLAMVLYASLQTGGNAMTGGERFLFADAPHFAPDWPIFFLPLTVPICMSVILARRFARRGTRLQAELERVEELSAQTLAQEREKQALIASQNERLEAEVEARTAELKQSQQQLIHAEKMASLGALTAGIAHEIKNPLNFINNFAEVNEELAQELREDLAGHPDALALVEDLLADLEQNAAVIAQHGKRADGIVKSMMAHAREGKGEREWVNLNALIDEHVELAYHGKRAQVPGFNATIERNYDDSIGNVEVVPQDFGRVMLNLLGNAFDAVMEQTASSNGQYEPVVQISSGMQAGGVEIRVKDNGPGMTKEVKAKVFEPFFTTKPTGSGTGLGLSLSYDIITQGHGGTLTVESDEDRGAAFVIHLPIEQG